MSGEQELKGPDLAAGVPLALIPDGGMLLGQRTVWPTRSPSPSGPL